MVKKRSKRSETSALARQNIGCDGRSNGAAVSEEKYGAARKDENKRKRLRPEAEISDAGHKAQTQNIKHKTLNTEYDKPIYQEKSVCFLWGKYVRSSASRTSKIHPIRHSDGKKLATKIKTFENQAFNGRIKKE